MGVKGSKNYPHSFGINAGEYANDYIGYCQANPAYHMPTRLPPQIPISVSQQKKSSPVQSSSQLVTKSEGNEYEIEKSTKFNTVSNRRKPASPEIIPYKSQKVSKSSLLQELLECPICMNLYDTPTVLPCQHTFCKSCIASLNSNDTPGNLPITIVCPICRESHLLSNGIDALTSNYTMKRLIELESMAPEKEKKKEKPKENAKCFVCQKYCQLKVCSDCSYMLCKECIQDPNHDIIIESKLHSKKKSHTESNRFSSMVKSETRFNKQLYSDKYEMYSDPKIIVDEKLKLILLCHSASVELKNDSENSENSDSCSRQPEIYEDEFGKCATYSKLSISLNERLITLKKIVEKKFGITLEDQIIVYKDRILKNDLKTLSSFQLRQYSKVHIFDERDLKENFNEDEEIYGTYASLSSPKTNLASKADKFKERTTKSVSPTNRDLFSPASPKKVYANTEEKLAPRGIRKDKSIYKTRRPSKIIYENDPNISNYTTIRRQNKYYSSAASFSKYANSNHYSNY